MIAFGVMVNQKLLNMLPVDKVFVINNQGLNRISINPLYTNRFFLLVRYNKLWIVHCTYLVEKKIFFSADIYLNKQCRP